MVAGTLQVFSTELRYRDAPQVSALIANPRRRASEPARYEFEVDGRHYGGTADTRVGLASLPVQYLAADPARNRPAPPPYPVAASLLLPLLFVLPFVWLLRKLVRDYRLVRDGRMTTAIVVGFGGVGEQASAGAIGYLVPVVYDFMDLQGRVVRGHSMISNAAPGNPGFRTASGLGAP
ncbi:MAG TPA: hypothetical protein VL994_07715, partial [Steroidobacteraceae bacterium]|nr:hypothetical protein [Steroidobacteraceae bacterium]